MRQITQKSLELYKMLVGKMSPDLNNRLIQKYAACSGNLDLYKKVCSNWEIDGNEELPCILRGIYKNLSFAYWCKDNIEKEFIQEAVSSKLIMNDDLSFVRGDIYCIWYPQIASEETYEKLVKMREDLKYGVARACAIAGYTDLYRSLNVLPEIHVLHEALEAENCDIVKNILSDGRLYSAMDDDYGMYLDEPVPTRFIRGVTCTRSQMADRYGDDNTERVLLEDFSDSDIRSHFDGRDPLKINMMSMNILLSKMRLIEQVCNV